MISLAMAASSSSDALVQLVQPSQRTCLEQCYTHLQQVGFGPLQLATLDEADCRVMGSQLADVLQLPPGDYIADAIAVWVEEAKEESKLLKRATGYLHDDLTWLALQPVKEQPKFVLHEPAPPPGEKLRRLLESGAEAAAREEKLMAIWVKKLHEELVAADAPVLLKLQGSLDPDRAVLLLVGSTRTSTLKRYLTLFRQWRLWLGEVKLRLPPGRPIDLVDHLMARRDEPCGRTVPEALLKAIAWMEKVAEFPSEERATFGRLAWAAKDKLAEQLAEGAPLTKRAPRYPSYLLAQMEAVVLDNGQTVGWRIWTWAKLLKIWGSLRWSDLQAIIPAELAMVEGRLVTILRKTKTSGPTRRAVVISERAFLVDYRWLETGFALLKQFAGYKRDYLLPRLGANGVLEDKLATYADAMVATAGILANCLKLPSQVLGFWTEHSERSVLPTGLSLLNVQPADKDLLGRWKPEGSDIYARSFAGRVARLQAQFAQVARAPDRYVELDEREIGHELQLWLVERARMTSDAAAVIIEPLVLQWKNAPLHQPYGLLDVPPLENNPAPVPPSVASDSDGGSEGDPATVAAKKARVHERVANYVVVELPGAKFRLHKAGRYGCWMGRRRLFRNSVDFLDKPASHEYTHVCRLCWPHAAATASEDELSEASAAGSGDEAVEEGQGELEVQPPMPWQDTGGWDPDWASLQLQAAAAAWQFPQQ